MLSTFEADMWEEYDGMKGPRKKHTFRKEYFADEAIDEEKSKSNIH